MYETIWGLEKIPTNYHHICIIFTIRNARALVLALLSRPWAVASPSGEH